MKKPVFSCLPTLWSLKAKAAFAYSVFFYIKEPHLSWPQSQYIHALIHLIQLPSAAVRIISYFSSTNYNRFCPTVLWKKKKKRKKCRTKLLKLCKTSSFLLPVVINCYITIRKLLMVTVGTSCWPYTLKHSSPSFGYTLYVSCKEYFSLLSI